jgi:hydroxyacylglutathione hydrolase
VTETHIHADYVSGARELAAATGARLYLSDEGGEDWKYAFADEADAVLLRDGDSFQVGNIRIDVMHTPGHTPEHMSFVVTDTAGADRPMGVFTGDFIFVGDVGRPDLLERAAKYEGTMEAGARTLFASLRRSRLAARLRPALARPRRRQRVRQVARRRAADHARLREALQLGASHRGREEFVDAVLAGQPEPPMYFAEMKRINKEGPRVLGGFSVPSGCRRTPGSSYWRQGDGGGHPPAERVRFRSRPGFTISIPLGSQLHHLGGLRPLPYDPTST